MPRLQSYCVLSLRILERMPACLPGFHLANGRLCRLHSFCMTKLFDVLMWSCRSLGPENLLLKGATLKNTQKIYGKLNDIDFIPVFSIIQGSSLSEKLIPLLLLFFFKVLQFIPAWRQRWLSTTRASLRNALLWRSKLMKQCKQV